MHDIWDSARNRLFTVSVTGVSRLCLARDRTLGRIEPLENRHSPGSVLSIRAIPIGRNVLDAVFVAPTRPTRSAALICHGIGEAVEHWLGAQQALAAEGVASLVFDYSGYGRSTGFVAVRQCELDAIAAFRFLQAQTPALPISLLGFSLGSGIAAAILPEVPAHRLVLCSAFTSFRSAAIRVGLPRALAFLAPDIWRTSESLRDCRVPALVAHCERDRVFPATMAMELHAACGSPCELFVAPGLAHNDPFYHPQPAYWRKIASFLSASE